MITWKFVFYSFISKSFPEKKNKNSYLCQDDSQTPSVTSAHNFPIDRRNALYQQREKEENRREEIKVSGTREDAQNRKWLERMKFL